MTSTESLVGFFEGVAHVAYQNRLLFVALRTLDHFHSLLQGVWCSKAMPTEVGDVTKVRAAHIIECRVWGQFDTHLFTWKLLQHGCDHLVHKANTILNRAPVLVCP